MKFLGIKVDNTLSRKSHTDVIVPKSSAAYFASRMFKPFMSLGILKMMHYACFHAIMNYGIIEGEIPHIVILFLSYKRGLSQLIWLLELETLVQNNSRN
jgi:hypothetical protein